MKTNTTPLSYKMLSIYALNVELLFKALTIQPRELGMYTKHPFDAEKFTTENQMTSRKRICPCPSELCIIISSTTMLSVYIERLLMICRLVVFSSSVSLVIQNGLKL